MDVIENFTPAGVEAASQAGLYHYDQLDREFLAARVAVFRDRWPAAYPAR